VSRPAGRAALGFVLATLLVDSIALGIILPVAPRLVAELGGGSAADGARTYGAFLTLGAGVQFFAAPLLGVLSDRFGRRPVLLLSLLGLAVDYVVLALAPTLGWLFVGRVVSAVTSATWAAAFAYIADVSEPGERAKAFGRAASAFGLGFVLGPALGGVLGDVSPRLPFWVAAGLTLANAAFGWLAMPESLAAERRAPFSLARANPVGALRLLWRERTLLGLATSRFLRAVAHDVQPVVFVLYASHRFGWNAAQVGWLLFFVGLCGSVVSAVLVTPLVQSLGERGTLLVGLASGATAFALFGWAPSPYWMYAAVPFDALWWVDGAAMQALLTRRVDESTQGELQGAIAALQSVAGLIAPPLFSLTFAHFIEPARTVQVPGAALYLAAGVMGASLVSAWWFTRGDKRVMVGRWANAK